MNLENIHKRASGMGRSLVFPEGDDPRIREAALKIQETALAEPVLITGRPLKSIRTLSPGEDPLSQGMELLAAGDCDGLVAGAENTTARVLKAALGQQEIRSGSKVSSFFLIETGKKELGSDGAFLFADCAVIPDPEPGEVAMIASDTAESARRILGWEPRVGLLSFSTMGSSRHMRAEKMREAARVLDSMEPDFVFGGELQLDAAIVPEVAARKDPGGVLKGRANILIFPDLDAANIGYKLAERIGGATAVGPVLQGLSKPVNDLSRGCSVNDIINVAAFTVLQVRS